MLCFHVNMYVDVLPRILATECLVRISRAVWAVGLVVHFGGVGLGLIVY